MSSMNFTCDSCGREVFGCTFVNGMKFCAKCYQETFGETDKDRKIADLEAKLAESERKNFELLTKLNLKEYAPAFCTIADRDCEALGQIEKLKQQLAEKEKENLTLFSILYETLEKQGYENITSAIEQMTNLTLEKQSNWLKENCVKDQDKISFAIQQLEKVKEYALELFKKFCQSAEYLSNKSLVGRRFIEYYPFNDYIDNQIKQLKELK